MDASFVLSKLFPLFLYPLGLVFTGTLASLLAALLGKRRWSIFFSFFVLTVVILFATPHIPNRIGWSIEKRYLPMEASVYPKADVIIVLGGGVSARRSPEHTPAINGRGDRFLEAARLYHASKAPFVLLSGGDGLEVVEDGQISTDGVQLLLELGIPNEAIIAEGNSKNTQENAIESQRLMKKHNFQNALLVTSAIHMPRSVATFKSIGLDVVPAPTDYRYGESAPDTPLVWYPQVEVMMESSAIIREYIGFAVYRWRGAITKPYSYLIDS